MVVRFFEKLFSEFSSLRKFFLLFPPFSFEGEEKGVGLLGRKISGGAKGGLTFLSLEDNFYARGRRMKIEDGLENGVKHETVTQCDQKRVHDDDKEVEDENMTQCDQKHVHDDDKEVEDKTMT